MEGDGASVPPITLMGALIAVCTDPGCALTLGVAVCAAGYSGVRSVAEERKVDAAGRRVESAVESVEIDGRGAVIVPLASSLFLLFLYYLGALGATEVLAVLGGGAGAVAVAFTFGSRLVAALVATAWVITGHWALNNILGVGLVCLSASHLRLPDLKTASLVLVLLVVYDVLWVYVSPWFMPGGDSVMVAVATQTATSPVVQAARAVGVSTYLPRFVAQNLSPPAKLILPALGSGREGDFIFLGLGDVVVPALLLSLALAWDARRSPVGGSAWTAAKAGPLFRASLAAYGLSILFTFAVGVAYNAAQPALFFIVPAMLAALTVSASRAGVLRALWHGPRPQAPDFQDDKQSMV